MSASSQTHTITAALPYANGPLHLGHLAGVFLPADIYARYRRSQGHRVLFLCGSDEHGIPITIRARKEKKTPQAVVDYYHKQHAATFQALDISFDVYDRTTNPAHYDNASAFFTHLHEKGKLTQMESDQYYDPASQQFLADRYIRGTCPHCRYTDAYGDQCEKCGRDLSPEELLSPRSALSDAALTRRKTTHWYLPLDEHADWLKAWIDEHATKGWRANVLGQCRSWLHQGLKARAVTRDLDWGVPVPLKEAKGKVLYVWFDAPIGYISATHTWAKQHGVDWRVFWQSPNTQLTHFIGKDNIVFHCIIFPAMLKAHGSYILPTHVAANEFLNLEGQKISTSREWAVWLPEYVAHYPQYKDVLRYVLCAMAPETKDSDFTWKAFQQYNNSELVGILGNFVHRTLTLAHRYAAGKVPPCHALQAVDTALQKASVSSIEALGKALSQHRFRDGLQHWMELARLGNKYLADTTPWHEKDTARLHTILHHALQLTARLTLYGSYFLPSTMARLASMLHMDRPTIYPSVAHPLLATGQAIGLPNHLFQRIDDAQLQAIARTSACEAVT